MDQYIYDLYNRINAIAEYLSLEFVNNPSVNLYSSANPICAQRKPLMRIESVKQEKQ